MKAKIEALYDNYINPMCFSRNLFPMAYYNR